MPKLSGASLLLTFCFALSLLPTAQADEPPVQALRADKSALFWYGSRELIDFEQLPVSDLPRGHPFRSIGLNIIGPAALDWAALVRAEDRSESLSEFARRAMQARLDELGASPAIRVAVPYDSSLDIDAPVGVTPCDLLSATIVFRLQEETIDNLRISALTTSFMATQQIGASEGGTTLCSDKSDRQQWTYVAVPRVVLLREADAESLHAPARDEILRLIDFEIVPRVLDTNATARSAVESWIKGVDWKSP